MEDYFALDGVSSVTKNIVVETIPPIVMPDERGEEYTVLGRAGSVFVPEGVEAYEPYVVPLTCHIKGAQAVHEAQRWLRGQHFVTFSTEPDRKQECRVLAGTEWKKVSPYLNWYTGEVHIKCQPYKYRVHADAHAVVSGETLINAGDLIEYPAFIATLTDTAEVTIAVDDAVFSFTADAGAVTVDGMAGIVKQDGEAIVTVGAFPALTPGRHTLTYTGATAVTVERRERFL